MRRDLIYQSSHNVIIDYTLDLEHNLILPRNNNFRQNPEYFFFKTKRESFRNHNLLSKLEILGIKLIKEEILEEIKNFKDNQSKICDRSFKKYNLEINFNSTTDDYNEKNKMIDCENLTLTDRIKSIIQRNVKEYIPKTFKIIVKENKND